MRPLLMLVCLSVLLPACGGNPTPNDAGQDPVDAAVNDAGSGDAGQADASPDDGGQQDGSAASDADVSDTGTPIDGDVSDAGSEPDAGAPDASAADACVPPACAAPPEGCGYVGGDMCSCGTLVCADAGMGDGDAGTDAGCLPTPCAAPPPGCQYVGSTFCTCGTLVCAEVCGDEPCSGDQYCDYSEATTCSGLGTCMARPDLCPDVAAPVCGCDGETHDNECFARRAGTDVASDGPC